MKPAHRRGLLLAYAAATFLAFPHQIGSRVIDLGAAAAWLAPALLVAALEGLEPRRAARWSFVAGLAAHAAILHWIYIVTVTYGHAPAIAGILAPVGLAAYIAAFTSAFGAGWAWLSRHALASAPVAAALWTALDHLRSFALSGFPWATLGYAQHGNPALLALAPLTGVYGLSFVTVLGGVALARMAQAALARRRPGADAWLAAAAVAAVLAVGALAGPPQTPSGAGTLRVAVVQGNIEQSVKWDPDWAERTLAIYEDLSRRATREGAKLVVWPETALPGLLELDAVLRERLSRLARETAADYVLGGVGVSIGSAGDGHRYYDSAFLLNADGAFTDRYDKSHLVPFGEYVPLRGILGLFVQAVASGIAPDNVTAGGGPRVVALPSGPEVELIGGVPICYELLFPDLVRQFVREGAGVLFAITNDAWYGRTGAPYQFLAITALRSAETGVWTARAANTGVSAIIDAGGSVRQSTRIFERAYLVAEVPVIPASAGRTFYVRFGDVFAYLCWIAVVAAGGVAWSRARRRRARAGEAQS